MNSHLQSPNPVQLSTLLKEQLVINSPSGHTGPRRPTTLQRENSTAFSPSRGSLQSLHHNQLMQWPPPPGPSNPYPTPAAVSVGTHGSQLSLSRGLVLKGNFSRLHPSPIAGNEGSVQKPSCRTILKGYPSSRFPYMIS